MEDLTALLLADYRLGRQIDVTAAVCRPEPTAVRQLLEKLRILLFPGYFREDGACGSLESYLSMLVADTAFRLEGQILPLLGRSLPPEAAEAKCREICGAFLRQIPRIRRDMQSDLQAFLAGDPAAAGEEEIIVSYPGYFAIMVYRLAHTLYDMGVPVLPRMMAEYAHSVTGIDIHPGATIGSAFFIDHGTGVVIGQTTVVGSGVKLYQGVTLGALSTRGGQSLRGKKRHPTIEDAVTVYAGASILGGDTVIGAGAVIGANAFVTGPVAPGTTVIGHRQGPV